MGGGGVVQGQFICGNIGYGDGGGLRGALCNLPILYLHPYLLLYDEEGVGRMEGIYGHPCCLSLAPAVSL